MSILINSESGITQGSTTFSPVLGFKNYIINGNFDVWRRSATGQIVWNDAVMSTYAGPDRWYMNNGSSNVGSRQAFTPGQTTVPNNPKYFMRNSNASVGTLYHTVGQRIEDVTMLAGKTVTLSFWAKALANKNIAVEFCQNFGTGGDVSKPVNAISVTTCALTTSWQKFTITVNLPSVVGKTLGTTANSFTEILFWYNDVAGVANAYSYRNNYLGSSTGTLDLAQVQLEEGDVATQFEMRPYHTETELCQRYYTVVTPCNRAFVHGSTGVLGSHFVHFPTSLRATATYTYGGGTSINTQSIGIVPNAATDRGLPFQYASNNSGLVYHTGQLIYADAEL